MKKLFTFSPTAAALIAFIVYLRTLAPSVLQIDSGELSAVQALAGIAHPTGYPLFTITGWLFAQIPLPFSTIYQLNLLAALWTAGAVFFISKTAFLLLEYREMFTAPVKQKGKKKKKEQQSEEPVQPVPEGILAAGAAAAGLALAFSLTFWQQSVGVEVYSLQALLFSLQLFFLFKAIVTSPGEGFNKWWYFFAAALASGFANHMTTLLIVPGAAWLYFRWNGFGKKALLALWKPALLFFALLAALYAWLPLRGAANPPLNWGDPDTWNAFYRHISGQQYSVWMFTSFSAAYAQFLAFAEQLPQQFGAAWLLIVTGIFSLFFYQSRLFWFVAIVTIFTVLYAVNYDIHDLAPYFLPAYLALALAAAFSVPAFYRLFRKMKNPSSVAVGLTALLVIIPAVNNFDEADHSEVHAYRDYTMAILETCDTNSIVLTYQWDYFLSQSYYFQLVEGKRPDVKMIGKELLRRSWYYEQLATNHPEVYASIETEANQFIEQVKPFEENGTYNVRGLENSYRNVMTALINNNLTDHTIYIAPELFDNELRQGELALPKGTNIIPDLFFLRIVTDSSYHRAPEPDFTIGFNKDNKYEQLIRQTTGTMLVRRALYELQYGEQERAKAYARALANQSPEARIPPQLRTLLGQ